MSPIDPEDPRWLIPRTPLDAIFDPTMADMLAQHERWIEMVMGRLDKLDQRLTDVERTLRTEGRHLRSMN